MMSKLNQKMNAVLAELNGRLTEREELLHDMAVALLTRRNLFILGQSGQAKSEAIRLFASCLEGATTFSYQFNNETDEEKLFGRLDMSSLIPGGIAGDILEHDDTYQLARASLEANYQDYIQSPSQEKLCQISQKRKELSEIRATLAALYGGMPSLIVRGKIPEAHIVMLDEVFKANGNVLHSLLTALNERLYANEGRELSLPAISFFGASNEMPNPYDPEDRKYIPLLDRFDLKVQTEYIGNRDKRLALLEQKADCKYGGPMKEHITLAELEIMQQEMTRVTVPRELDEVMDDVMCCMRAESLPISDRKFLGYHDIVKACAWLDSRDSVNRDDLMHLVNYLWMSPSDIPQIKQILSEHCLDKLTSAVDQIREQYLTSYHAFLDERAQGRNVEAIIKLRGELVEAYKAAMQLQDGVQSDAQRERVTALLEQIEEKNRSAHQSTSLTYLPLKELMLLNEVQ